MKIAKILFIGFIKLLLLLITLFPGVIIGLCATLGGEGDVEDMIGKYALWMFPEDKK